MIRVKEFLRKLLADMQADEWLWEYTISDESWYGVWDFEKDHPCSDQQLAHARPGWRIPGEFEEAKKWFVPSDDWSFVQLDRFPGFFQNGMAIVKPDDGGWEFVWNKKHITWHATAPEAFKQAENHLKASGQA